ncbi:endonuclease V [Flavobacterium sp. J372]|uniref:endonuclease V n=1 Tax=Flavobacterium sp. J372 TaxID=2898436 RepID=UPI0021518B45|nr:endonuclease V [Flavobacterium sp. J372]MCR5862504.1 endonuclease V [Flavobacterium sp. J372]
MLNYDSLSIPEATSLQNELRHKVSLQTETGSIATIAGGDISHNKFSDTVYAGIVVLSYPQLQVLSYSLVTAETKFPYVPGYLAFREVPALLAAWEQIPVKPDVMVLDGNGIVHPREYGIACHFGVLANHPAIGCAKSMLYGGYAPLGLERFSESAITTPNGIKGFALRTKAGVKPVYISPGHKISTNDSIDIIKNCTLKHRIPEPTRLAHNYVNQFRIGNLKAGYHVENVQQGLFDF